jgi:hypothetical protein
MVKTAEEQLDEVKKSLTKLKASNWVIRLKPLPVGLNLPGQRLLCDPEKHKVYDIAKKDFIDVKEFLDSQPDFKRVWQNFCE